MAENRSGITQSLSEQLAQLPAITGSHTQRIRRSVHAIEEEIWQEAGLERRRFRRARMREAVGQRAVEPRRVGRGGNPAGERLVRWSQDERDYYGGTRPVRSPRTPWRSARRAVEINSVKAGG